MRETFRMWRYTQMVVLTAVTAAVYAALLIPFKGFQIIPGLSEVRPAAVVPVLFGWLFGPAGAWGAALGNLIGDFFGTLGIGSLFGIIGNFCLAMTAYKVFDALYRPKSEGGSSSVSPVLACAVSSLVASASCALVIGWGIDLLRLMPFGALGGVIFINNSVFAVLVAPFLYVLLQRRVARLGLNWRDLMPEEDRSRRPAVGAGTVLVFIGSLGGLALGLALHWSGISEAGSPLVALGLLLFIILIFIGYLLA